MGRLPKESRPFLSGYLFSTTMGGFLGVARGAGEVFGDVGLLDGFEQVVGFLHIAGEAYFHHIEVVPPGVAGGHHHGAHARPAPLVVQQVVELGLGRLEMDLVGLLDGLADPAIESIDPRIAMALATDALHFFTFRLAVGVGRKSGNVLGANRQRCQMQTGMSQTRGRYSTSTCKSG